MQRPRSSALKGLAATASDLSVEFLRFLRATARSRGSLVAENLFLRKQLAFYREHEVKPRRLTDAARIAMVFCSLWFNWKQALTIVQPETLIRWHRRGFKLFWRRKSKPGRPRLLRNIRDLIAQMAKENPTWGQGRVASELSLKLGSTSLRERCVHTGPRSRIGNAEERPRNIGRRSFIITRERSLPVIFWLR
jgi:hypothetical protein